MHLVCRDILADRGARVDGDALGNGDGGLATPKLAGALGGWEHEQAVGVSISASRGGSQGAYGCMMVHVRLQVTGETAGCGA